MELQNHNAFIGILFLRSPFEPWIYYSRAWVAGLSGPGNDRSINSVRASLCFYGKYQSTSVWNIEVRTRIHAYTSIHTCGIFGDFGRGPSPVTTGFDPVRVLRPIIFPYDRLLLSILYFTCISKGRKFYFQSQHMVRNNVNYLETEFLKQYRDNKYYNWKKI